MVIYTKIHSKLSEEDMADAAPIFNIIDEEDIDDDIEILYVCMYICHKCSFYSHIYPKYLHIKILKIIKINKTLLLLTI